MEDGGLELARKLLTKPGDDGQEIIQIGLNYFGEGNRLKVVKSAMDEVSLLIVLASLGGFTEGKISEEEHEFEKMLIAMRLSELVREDINNLKLFRRHFVEGTYRIYSIQDPRNYVPIFNYGYPSTRMQRVSRFGNLDFLGHEPAYFEQRI